MYLAIRKVPRQTGGDQPNNKIGDVICGFEDDYLSSGKDFGRKGAVDFRWVHVPGMTQDDLDSLLEDTDISRRKYRMRDGVGRTLTSPSESPPVVSLNSALHEEGTPLSKPVIGNVRRLWAKGRKAIKRDRDAD